MAHQEPQDQLEQREMQEDLDTDDRERREMLEDQDHQV